MRILHVLEATLGGTRRHVLDLLPALSRRGVDCDLFFSPMRNPRFAAEAREVLGGASLLIPAPMTRGIGLGQDAQALRLLITHLRRNRYDAIHCHSTKAGFIGRLARGLSARRTPVVYTPHCVAFDTALPLPQRRAARWTEKLLASQTTHFIAVSYHEEKVLRHTGIAPSSSLTVIHNGIDLETFDRLEREEHVARDAAAKPESTEAPLTIGCFGRLTRQKNQHLLIEVAGYLQNRGRRVQLMLVGDGEDRIMLQQCATRLGMANNIAWLGEVVEPRPLYGYCDIVAQPSIWEGCPYSILEAMSARRAVVASAVGGAPELLGAEGDVASGLLYPLRRTDKFAEALLALHDHTMRHELGKRARARVERDFPLGRMVDKTIAVYDRLEE